MGVHSTLVLIYFGKPWLEYNKNKLHNISDCWSTDILNFYFKKVDINGFENHWNNWKQNFWKLRVRLFNLNLIAIVQVHSIFLIFYIIFVSLFCIISNHFVILYLKKQLFYQKDSSRSSGSSLNLIIFLITFSS